MEGRAESSQDWPADWFERVDHCLWCGSDDLSADIEGVRDWFFAAVPGTFGFDRCQKCRSLVLRTRPDAEHIALAYRDYYTHEEGGRAERRRAAGLLGKAKDRVSTAYIAVRYRGSRRMTDRALARFYRFFPARRTPLDVHYRYLPRDPSRVLDFGCGSGDFVRFAQRLGHEVTGVDFDVRAIERGRRSGIDLRLPDEMDGPAFAARFDHVTVAHVMEHVPDPVDLAARLARSLRKGGSLFVEVPNAGASGLAQFGKYWRGLEAPRHFSLPSREAMERVLREAGFGDIRVIPRPTVAAFLFPESARAAAADGAASSGLSAKGGEDEFLTVTAKRL